MHPKQTLQVKAVERQLLALQKTAPGGMCFAWSSPARGSQGAEAGGLVVSARPSSLLPNRQLPVPPDAVALGVLRPVAPAGADPVDEAISFTRNAVLHVVLKDGPIAVIEWTHDKRKLLKPAEDAEVDALLRHFKLATPAPTASVALGVALVVGVATGVATSRSGQAASWGILEQAFEAASAELPAPVLFSQDPVAAVAAIDSTTPLVTWADVLQAAQALSNALRFHDAGSFSRSPQLAKTILSLFDGEQVHNDVADWAERVFGSYLPLAPTG